MNIVKKSIYFSLIITLLVSNSFNNHVIFAAQSLVDLRVTNDDSNLEHNDAASSNNTVTSRRNQSMHNVQTPDASDDEDMDMNADGPPNNQKPLENAQKPLPKERKIIRRVSAIPQIPDFFPDCHYKKTAVVFKKKADAAINNILFSKNKNDIIQHAKYPYLESITIDRSSVTNETFQNIINHHPMLQEISITDCQQLTKVVIAGHQQIKNVILHLCMFLKEVIIHDCPTLTNFCFNNDLLFNVNKTIREKNISVSPYKLATYINRYQQADPYTISCKNCGNLEKFIVHSHHSSYDKEITLECTSIKLLEIKGNFSLKGEISNGIFLLSLGNLATFVPPFLSVKTIKNEIAHEIWTSFNITEKHTMKIGKIDNLCIQPTYPVSTQEATSLVPINVDFQPPFRYLLSTCIERFLALCNWKCKKIIFSLPKNPPFDFNTKNYLINGLNKEVGSKILKNKIEFTQIRYN